MIRKHLTVIAVLLAVPATWMGAVAYGSTQPNVRAVNWPATCTKMACVDRHLNNLDSRLRSQAALIASLRSWKANVQRCESHVSMTAYGADVYDYATGSERWIYAYNPTHYGDNTDYQFVYDRCTPAQF